ncbi:TPA: DNA polymerase III subunit theta [Enterobacter cloacae]|nr:DNA polymerase III subunit theta [Enterobacter cloacae]HEB0929645.1 DNA polymerase III subunit theta [Enterobacter cloacae]HEB0945631.1 DNA polymerase III subunit theta [Enterobacter cloacae]HEB0965752.1 DNA polymerase III subunit theta [Enterobacter cloacae]
MGSNDCEIIAAETQEVRDIAASGVAYKERLNMPVIVEVVMREQLEHLRVYFLDRLKLYREKSKTIQKGSDPRYIEMAEANQK